MKIIENTQFNRINLQFDEKPSKEILQKLKDEGWRYSPQHKLWYPSANAVENSRTFAESLQKDINNEASAYMESMQNAIDTNEPGFNSADEQLSSLIQNATDYAISPENTKLMVENIKQKVIKENESILEAQLIQMEKLLFDMKAELQTARERISKLENNNRNNNEITFPVVVLPQSSDFVESWTNNHNSVAKGLFIIKKDDKFVAIDNTYGECWVEDFDSLDKAVTYLTNSILSVDEIRELNESDAHAVALNKLTEADLVLINDNILNSNVFVTADIGNPVELALHNPKTGEYFLIQSIDDDDRWDYTLYDKDFKLIDGGQGVSGNITMPEDIKTAAQVVLKEFHPDDLSINDWVIRDYSDLSELINEIETADFERANGLREMEADISLFGETLKTVLKEKAQNLGVVEYTRKNYDKLFPFGIVETPVETVKLGEGQFTKLEAKERDRLLFAAYQTLKTPDIVFNERRVNSDTNELEQSHNYVKSFIFDKNTRAIQDIVVSIDGKNISITSHPREINNIVNKIKNPDQLIYISDEIGNLLKQRELINNEQVIVKPTIDKLTHPLNSKYSINDILSINDLSKSEQDIRDAQIKLNNIVTETFLTLTDEEKENGTTLENKTIRYEKWYKPMVDEIMADIANGNKEALTIVQNYDLDPETHVQGNKWYTAIEAFNNDVQYKLLPELYEKVQDRIKAEYEEKKIPYVVMFSSESPKFPSENKVYTVKEFNEILLQADSEFHNRKKYAEQKYGSADNYWDLERDDKLPEEDKGIQFGYDKTNFKFFNIPNPNNPEDTFSYEPSRYDIGDGNGSIFDYVRATCSHDEFIEALNALETQLYFPGVTDSQREFVEKTVEDATQNLKTTLKEKMENLEKAQNEYNELHKKWLIEATEADRVDELLNNALEGIKETYDSSMNDVFTKVLNEYPFTSGDVAESEFLKYTANEVKKMVISELYLPSRNAQKAMNAEDYKTYNSIDWAKLRRIWEKFPANVNMTAYAEKLLQDKCAEKGMSVSENTKALTPPTFINDYEKIKDFYRMTKEEFLNFYSFLTEEEYNATFDEIIHSDDFIEKFGDWEKAQRLEKLKNDVSLETDGKIILNGDDITETVVSLIENEDRKSIQSLEKEIGKSVIGKYVNNDTGLTFNVSNRNVTEISNHHYLWKEHIKSISLIPQISEKAIFIGEEENEDKKRNPNIVAYKYFATGIKIDDDDYTCKVVIGVDDSKNCYYDQSLSTIEKGKLIDILQEKNKLETESFELSKEEDNNLSPLITQREATSSYVCYDKRLIKICQVPQMPYLDEELKPTLAAVQAVHDGLLYIEKKNQQYVMNSLEENAENDRKQYKAEQGSNYDSNLSTTDIARNLRNYIKQNYPGYKFSVTSQYFSGGSSISVKLKETPVELTNFETMKAYIEKYSDNFNRIWDEDLHTYTSYYGLDEEDKNRFVEKQLRVMPRHSISRHNLDEQLEWMTPEAKKVMKDVVLQLESYNFDHSDSQSDYYHVNFWSDYGIASSAIEKSLQLNKEKSEQKHEEVHTDNEISLKEFINSDMKFDEEDTILHNKVTGKYVWLYRETGGVVGKFEYDSSFNETSRDAISYAGMKLIVRGAILEKNMDDWTILKDKRYFKPYQETEMSEKEREEFKQSFTSDNNTVTKQTELTTEDIEICKKVIPPAQFKLTMELTEGEEGEFFTNKLKQIADTYRKINTDKELINEDGTHNVGFRYFMGDTEIYLSEIDSDGIGFGYNILNGDLQMSEWGSTSLEEILSIPYMEMDYHVPEGMTIERMLYQEHPDYFAEYAEKEESVDQKRNADSYTNEILDKIRAAGIEVVTDKDEFDRILQQKEKLQKMSTSFSKIDFGTVEQWQIEEAKDIGLDLSDYKHQLTSDFITHVIKHHGNQITEASRGNIAITKDDLKSINEIITSADRVVYGVTRKEIVAGQLIDRQRIIYAKNQTDGTSLYFEEVLEGKKNKRLRGKTFFKRNGSIDDNTLLLILGNNKKRDNIEKAIIKAHPDVAVSSLSQHQNVDVAAVSTVSELDKSISDFVDKSITDYVNSKIQTYTVNSQIYGFVHNGKIYLNSELMNSNAAVHEYTHLWDAYTQKTNPELWNKGLNLFKDTKYWNEVISDPNYQDIKDDENLVLSEIHSRICGDIAQKVLERIAELDGEQVKLDAIDWNKETAGYVLELIKEIHPENEFIQMMEENEISKDVMNFFSTPMKDLMASKNINVSEELSWEELASLFQEHDSSTLGDFKTTKETVQKEETFETEKEYKDEVVLRRLDDILDFHAYNNDGTDVTDENGNPYSDKILEEKYLILEQISAGIVDGKITSLDNAQILLNDQLLHSDLYHQVSVSKQKEEIQDIKIVDEKNDAVRYDDKVKELEEQGFSLKEYGLVEYNNFNGPQYSVFSNGQKEITLRYRMEKVDGERDSWKAGVIYDTSEMDIEPVEPLKVYTFSPFGYEGTIVQVETDLRRGIPAYDIVGIPDSAVKETRERIRAAFRNSGIEMPAERMLQALSPADLRKDSPMDLAMAVGILNEQNHWTGEPVLALGELELSGGIRPVRGAVAAVNSAKAAGITNVVCDPVTAELLRDIDGIKILTAESLKEANEKLMNAGNFQKTEPVIENTETVQFNDEWMEDFKEALENLPMDGHFETIRAIEIAVAGKHNILASGAPGCGKTLLTQTLMPALTPKLTEEEAKQITRINSLAGLDSPKRDNLIPPFRMPHQTATIEGICGGGPNCRPGEISLAHNGTLFMDEAAEFRSSVIQLLRVPLESRQITLSRAGRSTTYPADFQLAMAMNPCPCGCYGSPDKICLDSARSIEQYWKKISDPLLDRVEIKTFVQKDVKDTRKISIEEMKAQIATAFEIQRKRGVYNSHMTPEDIQKYCKLDNESQAYLDKEEDKLTPREKSNLLKLSLTIANMDGREEIHINDIKEARELSAPVFEKPRQFVYDPEEKRKATVPQLDDVSITPEQIKDAENERKRITEPVLNGEKTEMYTSFKNFEDKGVFEINGTHLNVSKNGGLTPTGWKQLQAAMEIYRSKKFETFRYIIINEKNGEIADQLAITSHMPNFCNVSKPNDETLKQVISRLEELGDDYKLAVCHNHPSGNTTESSFDRELTDSLDRSLRRSDGMNKFLGHIILDHDTFNLAVPSQNNSGKCHWKKMEPQIVNEVDRFTADPKPEWADNYVGGTSALKAVAVKINDTENWNDDFIPVVFTNADRNISGVQYYSKSFFENESSQIRNEFQFSAMEAGAIGAFPVITDALWNKLGQEATNFEAVMKAHVLNDAFTDVAFNHTTMTEKYDIEAGRYYYSFDRDQSDRKIDVVSTWTPSINTSLFPPEFEQKKEQEIER